MERLLAEAYGEYQRRLRRANAFDFDDLISSTVAVLQLFPDVAEHYRRRFRHVLVDEYQDTNHAQYVLIKELVGTATEALPAGQLCVVGDADQSIYAFRGATIRNIEEFERDYPNATTIMLEQNYRSTQTILTAANAVISRNASRREKRLWTDAGAGSPIVGLRRRRRARRGVLHRERDRPPDRRRGPEAVGRRGLLPHQRPVALGGGDLHPGRPALPRRRRHPLLRAPRGPRRDRLPACPGEPRRRGLPAPHPQHPQARHRRPRGGDGRGVRRSASGSGSPRLSSGRRRPPASRPDRSPASRRSPR